MGKTRAMTSDCNWKNVESLEGTITFPSTVVATIYFVPTLFQNLQ